METIKFTFYGADRDQLQSITDDIRSYIERKGIEYEGPLTRPPFKATWESDESIQPFGKPASDEEIETLAGKHIHTRQFEFHRYSSDVVVNELVKRDYPDGVFVQVNTRQTEFFGPDSGHAPFSYDPESDYSSEM